ncbi:MAG TPA: glycyl-radical enzyme activating protein [Thermodesulfobacteriota bacterium]|nr:glycyl-radical enzyme activating protein [Thermodesulfobacteriota bacterium]
MPTEDKVHNPVNSATRSPGNESGQWGSVFTITKYMLEDGPGIRTVVFLKGCPLRCLWCSSPLCQSKERSVVYQKYKCISCEACLQACPQKALFVDEEEKIGRDFEKCTHCGRCTRVCPAGARDARGSRMSVDDVLARVEKDRIFYRRGGGGMTLSGGEILMQADFARNILQRCWGKLIHTTIETCAFGRWEDLRGILACTNLAFIDIKHIDPAVHRRLTGQPNDLILDNIRRAAAYLLELKRTLILRLAVVPGVNDSPENLASVGRFVKALPGEWELNLLPYHKYGVSKYDWLGQEYQLADVEPPSREKLREMAGYFESLGILCSLGGAEIKSAMV